MSKNLILDKFEEYKRQGMSTREAIKRIREEFRMLAEGRMDVGSEGHSVLKQKIEKMLKELTSSFSGK